MTEPVRLAVWSGPRNISTALMRSWENRPDTVVVDEPLYAYYLDETGLDHPGREEVIAAGPTDWRAAVADLILTGGAGAAVYYQKHMTHHLIPRAAAGLDPRSAQHRADPRSVRGGRLLRPVPRGRGRRGPRRDRADPAVRLSGRGRRRPPIIDATDFLKAPERYLRWLCDSIDVPFLPAMLSWPAGPRPSDGVWAQHWYAAVEKSTGFQPWGPRQIQLSGAALAAATESWPHYQRLADRRIRL